MTRSRFSIKSGVFADDGTQTCAFNQPGDSLGVAPNGRKYQNNPSRFVSPDHRNLDA